MTEKKPAKAAGVHIHSTGGADAAIVDDLRPKGRRRAGRAVDDAGGATSGAAESASRTPSEELPLPEAPATADPEPPDAGATGAAVAEAGVAEAAVAEAVAPTAPAARGNARRTIPATPRTKGIPAPDPRLPEVEKALARGDWAAITKLLDPSGEPGALSPPMRLLWAVATKEANASAGSAVDNVAIEALAELLDVGKQSPMALVLAKRTLRRRAWTSTPAPSATVSGVIIVLGLVLGLGIGWLATILLY